MNVFLIGFRCTGKTTVGRIVAHLLDLQFVDTDQQFAIENGQSIDHVVKSFGWDHFRQRETVILQKISAKSDQVVATGGGIILDPANRTYMKRSGTVVWLDASMETIIARMTADADSHASRPSLTGQSPTEEIEELLSQRRPLYRKSAGILVLTDGRTPTSIANEIVQTLKYSQSKSPLKR